LEAKYMLTRNDSSFQVDVSEQQLVNDHVGTINGGWPESALNYFTSTGVVSEVEMPYGYTDPPYWPLQSGWENRAWRTASNANRVTATTDSYKALLKADGPMSTCLNTYDLYVSVEDVEDPGQYRSPSVGANHAVLLVGYVDDALVQTGGYWIIKNSWGTGHGDNGYNYVPYGTLEAYNYTSAIDRGAFYTGSMAAAAWNGGTGTWSTGGDNWTSGGSAYAWENKETAATFSGAGGTVTISGTVLANGVTIDSGSSYTFTGGTMTLTSGGLMANSSATISSAVFIGGGGSEVDISGVTYMPQAWNVASGCTLTVQGAIHTIVSDVMFSGAGTTIIQSTIDGGGLINDTAEGGQMTGGAKPGRLIQNGTGTLTLSPASGALNFGGDVVVGAGTLRLETPFNNSVVLRGAILGGGNIVINSSSNVYLGSAASNFAGSINTLTSTGTVNFMPATGVTGIFSGPIQGTGRITQNGAGTTVLSGTNIYTGRTTINSGVLQADDGFGLPAGSFLSINGGILQSNGTATFTRNLGTASGTFYWSATGGGGGFSAGGGNLTVNIGGSGTPATLLWGTSAGTNIIGTLKLSSPSALSQTILQNPINLRGADRTILVNDNPNATTDFASITGAIGNTTGTAGIVKSGTGLLVLSTANNYNGNTTISGGALQADPGAGIPSGSFLILDGGVIQNNATSTFTRGLGMSGNTFQMTANGGGFAAGTSALAVNIGGSGTPSLVTWGTAVGTNLVGPLKLGSPLSQANTTFQNPIDLNGADRTVSVDYPNHYTVTSLAIMSGNISNSTGTAGLVKGGEGKLKLTGALTYNGATTVTNGTLDISTATSVSSGHYIVNGGTEPYGASLDIGFRTMTVAGLQLINGGLSSLTYPIGTLNSLSTVDVQGSCMVNSILAGSSGMTVSGTGIAYVYATPTFTGPITVQSGTLNWQASTLTNTNYILNGGRFDVMGLNGTAPIQGFTLNGSTVSGFAGTQILASVSTYDVRSGSIQSPVVLGGSAGLTKSGPGTVYIYKQPTYTGTTTVQDGYIGFGQDAIAPTGDIVINGGRLVFNGTGGAGNLSIGNLQINGGDIWCSLKTLVSSTDYELRNGMLYGQLGGSVGLNKTTSGVFSFSNWLENTYTGPTTISGGMLIAAESSSSIRAMPAASLLRLDGGVFAGGTSFTRSLGTSGDNTLLWTLNGGGFAAGYTEYIVNVGGSSAALQWSSSPSDIGSKILGTLRFNTSDSRCTARVAFQNPIDLNGADRTIFVDDNPASNYNPYNYDHAEMLGVISNSTGTAGIIKTGPGELELCGQNTYNGATTIVQGTLVFNGVTTPALLARNVANDGIFELRYSNGDTNFSGVVSGSGGLTKSGTSLVTLSGSSGNTYTGVTRLVQGNLDLAKTSGYAIPGDLYLSANNGSVFLRLQGNNQIAPTAKISFTGGSWPHFEMLGHSQTVAGISDTTGLGVIENTQFETGISLNGVLTVNNAAECSFNGYLRDGNFGGSTGKFALIKNGPGALTLSGVNSGGYTGGLTVNAGTLDYSGGVLPACNYVITGGTLNIGAQSKTIPAFQITGGMVTGSGTLTASATYDIQAGTINPVLAGAGIALNKTGAGTAILTNNNTCSGTTTVSQGVLQLGAGGATGTVVSNIVIGPAGTLDINRSNNVSFNNKISGSGTLSKEGTGTVLILGANTFSGNLVVKDGTLNYSGNSTLPAGNYSIHGGDLLLGSLSKSIGVFQITGGTVSGSSTLTSGIEYDIQAGTVTVALAGDVGLRKTQGGVAVLEGLNTFTGTTIIEDGTLALVDGGKLRDNSNVDNDGVFKISDGVHAFGNVIGSGFTYVENSARLNAASIVQDTLSIGGGHISELALVFPAASQTLSVPEPNSLVLLTSLVLVSTATWLGRKWK
jgi:autotransporter-associated beta strand protein